MNIGRINLSFNLDDPKAKTVYEYLKRADKSKSSTVIEAISKTFLSEFYWENYMLERECALAEKVIEHLQNAMVPANKEENHCVQEMLCEIIRKIDTLTDNINNGYQPITTPKEKKETPSENSDEINEDAFASMKSMFGGFG